MVVLELDSPAAIRTLNGALAAGLRGHRLTAPVGAFAAGSVAFSSANEAELSALAATNEVVLRRVAASSLPAVEPVSGVARIAVLAASNNQEVWALRELGYVADAVSTAALNGGSTDPLAAYDTIFNSGTWPAAANTVARTRLSAFFARGGGYVGGGTNAGAFLVSANEVAGLATSNRSGNGRSGIINWVRESAASPITGAYPERDTAIVDPPVWFTSVPSTMEVDGRLPQSSFLAAGLWPDDAQSASAPGAAVIAHGTNTARTSRMAVFAMNPLYRAIPEREWPMLASALNWSAAGPGVAVEDVAVAPVGGVVPATLSLTLGAPASFGAFTPGVARVYEAATSASVISSAGNAALTVSDPSSVAPGRLVNGSFALASPLLAGGSPLPATVKTYAGPVSNDPVTIAFRQSVAANEPLRTGTYAKTLTFTLSTTAP